MNSREILRISSHRPWPLPQGPWLMRQRWSNLLFAHWPVPAASIRPLVPAPLNLDTYEGEAWIGITPFDLGVLPRGMPAGIHCLELNCRTYVDFRGKPGVFFFSLDASSSLAVWGARLFYRLPYFKASMRCAVVEKSFEYSSRRRVSKASFAARYAPKGAVRQSMAGSLEHWLTERYCLYTVVGNKLYRAEIHHLPWPLQDADCEIRENSIASADGICLPDTAPCCHFASELDVLVWRLERAN